ncbi:MAG: 5-formyltetrahydrofolate cyclo-ligase [Chitinispirillales bacterium]|jgi:5-formyltetrahydrofolate cyclo-ligase|nr:5-formyltetrahydrofolate cyclo-ligase [Chitinispirillales bacterium]
MKTAEINFKPDLCKQNLRAKYLDIRKNLGEDVRKEKSVAVTKHILSMTAVIDSGVVMAYHSIGSEADTFHLMRDIIDSGRLLALPYCIDNKEMGIAGVYNLESDMEKGPFGTVQPKRELWGNIDIEEIGVCICPGVAFDRYGTRLGRGGGFYDNFLRRLKSGAVIIGCCFECQISEVTIPKESHDVDMDFVVSENGLINRVDSGDNVEMRSILKNFTHLSSNCKLVKGD